MHFKVEISSQLKSIIPRDELLKSQTLMNVLEELEEDFKLWVRQLRTTNIIWKGNLNKDSHDSPKNK